MTAAGGSCLLPSSLPDVYPWWQPHYCLSISRCLGASRHRTKYCRDRVGGQISCPLPHVFIAQPHARKRAVNQELGGPAVDTRPPSLLLAQAESYREQRGEAARDQLPCLGASRNSSQQLQGLSKPQPGTPHPHPHRVHLGPQDLWADPWNSRRIQHTTSLRMRS